jgi:putative copper export protein
MNMAISEQLWFRVINDSLHDLAAGVGPGAVIGLWLVRDGARATLEPPVFAGLTQTWASILIVLFLALTVLVLTGALRLTYRTIGVKPEALASRGRAALIKHALFVSIFIVATAAVFSMLQA